MGRAKNVAIAVVLLILAFLVILVIVTVVREYNASHQKPKDPNSDNPVSDDPKHKKIPTDYFIGSDSTFIGVNGSKLIYESMGANSNIISNPELGTWTFSDELDYVVKNKKPVSITFKQSGVLNGSTGTPVTLGDISAKGVFLITPSKEPRTPFNNIKLGEGYYISGLNSASYNLAWGCEKDTNIVTYGGYYGPTTLKIWKVNPKK
jgi:hypothetical protein